MKKAFLPLAVSLLLPMYVAASQDNHTLSDAVPPSDTNTTPSFQQLLEMKNNAQKSTSIQGQSNDVNVQRILVFYQPSYADKFGIDVIHKRIEKSILNDYQNVAGEGRLIEIVDILPLTSVSDTLPYGDRIDLSGDLVQLGYNYINDFFPDIYDILGVGLDENKPEGQLTLKHEPDLVTIFRDRRPDEGGLLGLGVVTGRNTLIFDSGSGISTPDEYNVLTVLVPHEFGHNHGLSHELNATNLDDGSSPVDESGNYTFNHATQCGDAVTLMWSTLSDTTEVLDFYSSPEKYHKGEVCGRYPDNVLSLNGAYNQWYYDLYYEHAFSKSASSIPAPGSKVSFLEDSLSVSESEGKFTFNVVREGDLSKEAHVYVRVTDNGAASYPEDVIDYKAKAFFGVGESNAEITFAVMQDMLEENSEVLELELVYPFNTSDSSETLQVRINDSFVPIESRGVVSLVPPSVPVVEGGVGYIEFERVGGSKGDILISLRPEYYLFEDTGLTAHETEVGAHFTTTEGRDYLMPNSLVVFRDGQKTLRVPVQTLDDLDPEPIEGLTLTLASLSGDVIEVKENTNGAMLISDDDAERAGVIAIESDTLDINESDKDINFKVFRDLDFEGGVPFDVIIKVNFTGGIEPQVIKLRNSFEEKFDYDPIQDGAAEQGGYEAVKYFTHELRATPLYYGDYTVEVSVVSLIDNGLVDPDKNRLVFNVQNDKNPPLSENTYPSKKGESGGTMNIVYLLAIGAVVGFRARKKSKKKGVKRILIGYAFSR
jgi:hypothetical protein